ncbi:FUSC family protein [Gordonia hankookensis]|uniref:FUSC family protein n=1 Tax=Gordonia hankookensis TaxID=589403 RepID=A0ABR7WEX7_9ACTN|nr:FUSC family protein [Gordonia hankookensis]MBD1321339.1 FUSC family protein [Gordonia hankookensis]
MSTATRIDQVRDRRGALLYAVHPQMWRSSLRLDLSRASVAVPIRVGFAVGSVLIVGGLAGQRDVAGFAALGALTSAFCRPDPYRVRVGRLVVLGIGIVASVGLGVALGLSGAPLVAEIAAVAVLGGLAALLVGMLHIAGPGAVIFVFAATGAMGFAQDANDVARALVATTLGAICGAVASLAPWLLRNSWQMIRPAATTALDTEHPTVRHESIRTTLRRRPRDELLVNSCRIAVAIVVSAVAASAAGLSHPMWAAMGSMSAMQGVAYHVTVQRGWQRLLGNVVGAVIAATLLGLGLGYWGAVVAIVVCQIVAEVSAPVNYAIASVAVTPMALLLTALSAGLAPAAAVDRVIDTLIGVVVGIVVAALTVTGSGRIISRAAAG